MTVNPTSGVDASRINLSPPVGARGLPLTLVLSDSKDDTFTGDTDGFSVIDDNLWLSTASGSGTLVNPSRKVPRAAVVTQRINPLDEEPSDNVDNYNGRFDGITLNTAPPAFNAEYGSLEFGQAVQDLSRSRYDAATLTNSYPYATWTLSDAGRYVSHPTRLYTSARPGNYTWQTDRDAHGTFVYAADFAVGSLVATGTEDCTDQRFYNGGRVTAITHFSKVDLPSNGLGSNWGDNHNSAYLTVLGSSSVEETALHGFTEDDGSLATESCHWSLNLGVRQRVLASGASISSPDGCPHDTYTTAEDLLGSSTIQHLIVRDSFNTGTPTGITGPSPVGRVDLGNHVVADSCGLIGYEGVFTATAFFSIAKDANPDGAASGEVSKTDELTYAGLNIEVHSGESLRRNGRASVINGSDGHLPYMKYGTDGSHVQPMMAALKTRADRQDGSFSSSEEANLSTFSVLRKQRATVGNAHPNIVEGGTWLTGGGLTGVTNGKADAILGESATGGDNWGKTSSINSAFLAEQIPTRVRIVPSVIGYTDVSVSPGDAKLATHPLAGDLTFKKPIVDYHVLVSVAPRTNQVMKSNLDATDDAYGDPTTRNNPNPKRLHTDADFSETGAVIYHAIFRINPDTLEQVFFVPGEAPSGTFIPDADCLSSVMPRHSAITADDRCDMGWGLHQVTPFRPLASRDFAKVPRLCGAVEAGGFYQRGGVGHLFDAAAFGGELFVAADTLHSSDLGVESTKDGQPHFGKVWGRGQIWPNGTATAAMPPGQELLVFRYTPHTDPYHPNTKDTTKTDNPLHNALSSAYAGYVQGDTDFNTALRTGFTISDQQLLNWGGWNIHDWVFPQIEQMRYLGREDKGVTTFPNAQHPTLHCSSLRIMEDGSMEMVAVHRDYIGSVDEYPTSDVGYPPNPDIGRTTCPPGYFLSDGQCVPISTAAGDLPVGTYLDPISGEAITGDAPSPTSGSSGSTPTGDAFGDYPSWSKVIADTHARSVILLWTPVKAEQGKIPRRYQPFEITYEEVATGDGNRETLATQTWTDDRGWWSGARIAWWYEESGQRAIPLTYGTYPESRTSSAHLPISLPFLDTAGAIRHGFPLIQTSINALENVNSRTTPIDSWFTERTQYLERTRFVPTTVGFADFGAGANPHQELGWSGWSFPAGLFDPVGYGDGSDFFSDSATKAKWAEFGGIHGTTFSTETPSFTWDLSGVTVGWEFSGYRINGVDYTVTPPTPFVNAEDLVLVGLSPISAPDWQTLVELPFFTETDQNTTGNPVTNIVTRTYTSTTPPATPMRFVFSDPLGISPDLKIDPVQTENASIGSMRGPLAAWSYHGPLHYGVSKTNHPYKVDKVWKQVHAGVGYDIPLQLLAPGQVQVRARAGMSNSIDLEVETPFHRTDTLALQGAAALNTGFAVGVTDVPGGSRQTLGQWFLRTNLWAGPNTYEGAGVDGLFDFERIHGPSVSGDPLYSFWADHPTEHFHAGAIPLLPNTDYDLAMIETSRYVPAMLKTVDRLSLLDSLAVSEQLLSSVDVHISKSTKPMWDSGSIVSAQTLGVTDAKSTKATQHRNEIATNTPQSTSTLAGDSDVQGLGKGQRSVRTPDGTLHTFFIRRGATTSTDPFWTHFKKPLHGDLFWNGKALKSGSPDTYEYEGKDQCGPDLSTLGNNARLHGAAFCSDSKGTIHAVIEVHADPSDTGTERSHRLYYHKAERVQVGANPEAVYDWDWTIHTPIIIQTSLDVSTPAAAGSAYDFRQPSLVCDSQDRLHLVCQQVWNDASTDSTTYAGRGVGRVLYTIKQPSDTTFPDYTQTDTPAGSPNDGRWQTASYSMATIQQTIPDANISTSSRHAVQDIDSPKVCLRSDDTPVVFYRGASPTFTTANRRYSAVYVNYGQTSGGTTGTSAGGFDFSNNACHVVGLGPDANNSGQGANHVHFYDAIIDEADRVIVVATLDDATSGGTPTQSYASRQTYLTHFDGKTQPADQYTSTNGLGVTRVLLKAPVYDGTTETRYLDPKYRDIVLTTNGSGELHIILGFLLTGEDAGRVGATFRDADGGTESGIAPLQWPAVPDTEDAATAMYAGGYAEQSTTPDWSDGGTYNAPASPAPFSHFMHLWLPSIEFDQNPSADDWVIRSLNMRWLSVPSLQYDATLGWQPIGSAQTGSGEEDFTHFAPQLRYQRWWGFNTNELDLIWLTNEQSWMVTPHEGSRLFMPSVGGVSFQFGGDVGQGIPGYPSGV